MKYDFYGFYSRYRGQKYKVQLSLNTDTVYVQGRLHTSANPQPDTDEGNGSHKACSGPHKQVHNLRNYSIKLKVEKASNIWYPREPISMPGKTLFLEQGRENRRMRKQIKTRGVGSSMEKFLLSGWATVRYFLVTWNSESDSRSEMCEPIWQWVGNGLRPCKEGSTDPKTKGVQQLATPSTVPYWLASN